ncbi:benzoate 4-monooxygenase [Amniculicola lignicola CBS 123094]|uniref:Benzoate 4-monooxygenase n=1 Tax=Amniculicola lignicola CBS 123094 TaxID=1392246 RepID=A0A6A5W390_9PLEO|nr:benzoate 4-monooxygenase [Amniculicola lignicola CBS 123094]
MNYALYLPAFISGASLELLLFRKGEWDRRSGIIVKRYAILFYVALILMFVFGQSIRASVASTLRLQLAFLGGLYSAMACYRLFFHPLKSFPGPFGARLSIFWYLKESIPDMQMYVRLRELHKEQGDFIRIKPRELSICHPDAVVEVHGPQTKMLKGEFYDVNYPQHNLQMTRDPGYHHQKRRYWDKAFNTKALKSYEPRLKTHFTILMDIFSKHAASKETINASKTFMDYSFDVISDLTFGKPFNMLTTGEPHPIIKEFIEAKKIMGTALSLTWLFHILRSIPWVEYRMNEFIKWYKSELDDRSKASSPTQDFYTHLSQSETFEKDGPWDAQLAIFAGGDTVSTTLTNICYLLAEYPEYQERLNEDLNTLCRPDEELDDQTLSKSVLLGGIINEALRLYPPVPSGGQRLTPPEGIVIAGRYIPGNMNVITPAYSIQRDVRAFPQPDDFIPERWYSRPELILRKDAFFPFSYGHYNCAGKPLAMMELRMVIGMAVRKFKISFPLGKKRECRRYVEEQADCFVMHTQPLSLMFEDREGKRV